MNLYVYICTCMYLCVCVPQVDVPFLHRGDVVRMIDDMAKVYSLQKGHGEWVDDMALVSRYMYSETSIHSSIGLTLAYILDE